MTCLTGIRGAGYKSLMYKHVFASALFSLCILVVGYGNSAADELPPLGIPKADQVHAPRATKNPAKSTKPTAPKIDESIYKNFEADVIGKSGTPEGREEIKRADDSYGQKLQESKSAEEAEHYRRLLAIIAKHKGKAGKPAKK